MGNNETRNLQLCRAIDAAVRRDAARGRVRPLREYIRDVLENSRPPFYHVCRDRAMRVVSGMAGRPPEACGGATRAMWAEIYMRYRERLDRCAGGTRAKARALRAALLTRPSRYFVSEERARRLYNKYMEEKEHEAGL